jgi:hypothetical protein
MPRKGLGPTFDARHEQAWTKVYDVMSDTMQVAASKNAPPVGEALG